MLYEGLTIKSDWIETDRPSCRCFPGHRIAANDRTVAGGGYSKSTRPLPTQTLDWSKTLARWNDGEEKKYDLNGRSSLFCAGVLQWEQAYSEDITALPNTTKDPSFLVLGLVKS